MSPWNASAATIPDRLRWRWLAGARRLDAQDGGRLRLELNRRVIDAEARVHDGVQGLQQALAVADVVHDDVGAHGLAPGRERPHVQIVYAAHARHGRHRLLD